MDSLIQKAADLIKNGGIIAFPTETVYGLGADALDPEAVAKIFKAKGRPSDNPLIVHIAEIKDLEKLAQDIPEEAYILAKGFWPGPLTLVLKRQNIVPDITTSGLDTVAIRLPDHEIARSLIRQSGKYLAAPSANKSGRPSPTDAATVRKDFTEEEVPLIIDGGPTQVGLESTVLDLSVRPFTLLRSGGVSQKQIEYCLSDHSSLAHCKIRTSNPASDSDLTKTTSAPKSPGMKYKHYSPQAKLILCHKPEQIHSLIKKLRTQNLELKTKIGILCCKENHDKYPEANLVIAVGSISNLEEIASNIFRTLREFDSAGVDLIISESFPTEGIGLAIMDRLTKAASKLI